MKKLKKLLMSTVTAALIASMAISVYAYSVSDSLINAKWQSNGGTKGFLGKATTNTLTTPNKLGVYNHFEGGSIYRKKTFNEAYTIYGCNRAKWSELGWENSFLGFPTTDELDTYNKMGRFNHFEGGSIYYKNGATKSYEVHGDIRALWSWFGWETSQLGYPKSDEYNVKSSNNYVNNQEINKASRFDNGIMYWNYTPATTGGMLSFPASCTTWPVMTTVKKGASTPYGTQKINSVDAYLAYGGEFPGYGYTVEGSGFPAKKKVTVYVSSVNYCFELGKITTNSKGSFTFEGTDGGGVWGVPAYNGIVTVWARSEDGPAAIYSYKPTNVTLVNYKTLR